jgi:hypothetical protein
MLLLNLNRDTLIATDTLLICNILWEYYTTKEFGSYYEYVFQDVQ